MSDEKVVVAVDAMGGDDAPGVVLDGVAQALASDPALEIVLCGPADVVEPFAAAHERCTPQACSEVIAMAEHPANAVRKKKDSSIVVGCRLVKEGAAQGFFSAGSTGACLAAGTLVMGRIKGAARPALATVIPSPVRPVVMCDIGANADCKPEYLVQFGQMASIYAEKVIGIEHPRAALLNIGEEETKGNTQSKATYELLKADDRIDFVGNVEASYLFTGKVADVVVCDGFVGNTVLKMAEGLYHINKKLGGGNAFWDAMNYENVGGTPVLGVNAPVVIGHGISSPKAIRSMILSAERCITADLTAKLQRAFKN